MSSTKGEVLMQSSVVFEALLKLLKEADGQAISKKEAMTSQILAALKQEFGESASVRCVETSENDFSLSVSDIHVPECFNDVWSRIVAAGKRSQLIPVGCYRVRFGTTNYRVMHCS